MKFEENLKAKYLYKKKLNIFPINLFFYSIYKKYNKT